MTTIYRGLMSAATQTPTDPAARLRALQQRIQTRRQGQQVPPRNNPQAQLNPHPGMPPRGQGTTPGGYDGSGINPGANLPGASLPRAQVSSTMPGMQPRPPGNTGIVPPHMQQQARPFAAPAAPQSGVPATPAAASTQAMPQRPPGMPTPGSGINPTVPGVTMPDAAKAPRPSGGLMAPMPYEMS